MCTVLRPYTDEPPFRARFAPGIFFRLSRGFFFPALATSVLTFQFKLCGLSWVTVRGLDLSYCLFPK